MKKKISHLYGNFGFRCAWIRSVCRWPISALPYPGGKLVLIIAGATECAIASAIVIAIVVSGRLIALSLAWVDPRTAARQRIRTVNPFYSITSTGYYYHHQSFIIIQKLIYSTIVCCSEKRFHNGPVHYLFGDRAHDRSVLVRDLVREKFRAELEEEHDINVRI